MQSAGLQFHGSTWCLTLLCAGGVSSSPLVRMSNPSRWEVAIRPATRWPVAMKRPTTRGSAWLGSAGNRHRSKSAVRNRNAGSVNFWCGFPRPSRPATRSMIEWPWNGILLVTWTATCSAPAMVVVHESGRNMPVGRLIARAAIAEDSCVSDPTARLWRTQVRRNTAGSKTRSPSCGRRSPTCVAHAMPSPPCHTWTRRRSDYRARAWAAL